MITAAVLGASALLSVAGVSRNLPIRTFTANPVGPPVVLASAASQRAARSGSTLLSVMLLVPAEFAIFRSVGERRL